MRNRNNALLLLLLSILFYSPGCVLYKAKDTENNGTFSLNEVVKTVLAHNDNFDAAKKNITLAYSSYFKSISDMLPVESSESLESQLKKIKTAETALQNTFKMLDKHLSLYGREKTGKIIDKMLIEDTVLTFYNIQMIVDEVQINRAEMAFYEQNMIYYKQAGSDEFSIENLAINKNAQRKVQNKFKEYSALMRCTTEKLATLMGVTVTELAANFMKPYPDAFDKSIRSPRDRNYYLEQSKELSSTWKIHENYLKVADYSPYCYSKPSFSTEGSVSGSREFHSVSPDLNKFVTAKYNYLIDSIDEKKKKGELLAERKFQRDWMVRHNTSYSDKFIILILNQAQNKFAVSFMDYMIACVNVQKADAILNFTVGNYN